MLENVIDNYPYAIFKGWKNIQRQHTSKAE